MYRECLDPITELQKMQQRAEKITQICSGVRILKCWKPEWYGKITVAAASLHSLRNSFGMSAKAALPTPKSPSCTTHAAVCR
jgi:hypothetical protein